MGELEPLDDDLAQLFAEDFKTYEARPSSAKDALRAVEQRIALEALGGRGTATGEISKRIADAAWGTKAVAAIAVVSFSAGIGMGRFLPTSASPSRPSLSVDTSLTVNPPSSSPPIPATTPPPLTSASGPAPNPAPELHPLAKATVDPVAGRASESTLMAERDLIDTARAALSRGRADDALSAVERHATRFPNGALAEEREALAVQALSLAGRNDLAKQRAIRFHRRYPTSIFGNAIDAAVSEIVRDK